jgi:hypothetical protein
VVFKRRLVERDRQELPSVGLRCRLLWDRSLIRSRRTATHVPDKNVSGSAGFARSTYMTSSASGPYAGCSELGFASGRL